MPCNFPGGGSGGGSKERAGEEPKEGPTKSESKPAASFRTIILVFYIHRLATSLVMLFQVTKDIASLLGDHGLWEGKLRDSGVSQPWWSKIDINMYPCVLDSCKLILLLLWNLLLWICAQEWSPVEGLAGRSQLHCGRAAQPSACLGDRSWPGQGRGQYSCCVDILSSHSWLGFFTYNSLGSSLLSAGRPYHQYGQGWRWEVQKCCDCCEEAHSCWAPLMFFVPCHMRCLLVSSLLFESFDQTYHRIMRPFALLSARGETEGRSFSKCLTPLGMMAQGITGGITGNPRMWHLWTYIFYQQLFSCTCWPLPKRFDLSGLALTIFGLMVSVQISCGTYGVIEAGRGAKSTVCTLG